MPEPIDWSAATFDGNRQRHHEEFRRLPFSEKLARLEEMAEVAATFAARRQARGCAAPPAECRPEVPSADEHGAADRD